MSEISQTSVILFDAAVTYANETADTSIRSDLRIAFVAGAEWQWNRVESDVAAKDAELERLRERLDIGPQGEDAIDVAESAMGFLRHRIETLEEALKPFRRVAGRLFETNANASDVVFEAPHVKHMADIDLTAGDFFAVAASVEGGSDA